MTEELISIIVPVYKVEKYLKRCVDSLICQTYKNLEIILVDDGSPDSCPQLCDEYAKKDSRIKVIHKQNGGVSSARNEGLKFAHGEYIGFVDSDDYVHPSMYEKLIDCIHKNQCQIATCRFSHVNEKGTEKKHIEKSLEEFVKTKSIEYFFTRSTDYSRGKEVFSDHNIMCAVWKCLYKKNILEDICFSEDICITEDLLFNVNVLIKNPEIKMGFVDESLYYYFAREQSLSRSFNRKMITSYQNFIYEMQKICPEQKYENLIKAIKFDSYTSIYVQALLCKEKVDISAVESWNTKENYKAHKKYAKGLKYKLKSFLARHKLAFVLKLLYKIKG